MKLFSKYSNLPHLDVTDRRTDGRTDGRSDGQRVMPIPRTAYHRAVKSTWKWDIWDIVCAFSSRMFTYVVLKMRQNALKFGVSYIIGENIALLLRRFRLAERRQRDRWYMWRRFLRCGGWLVDNHDWDVTEAAISAHLGQRSSADLCACTDDYTPVCASLNGVESTYGNECYAECEYVSFSFSVSLGARKHQGRSQKFILGRYSSFFGRCKTLILIFNNRSDGIVTP